MMSNDNDDDCDAGGGLIWRQKEKGKERERDIDRQRKGEKERYLFIVDILTVYTLLSSGLHTSGTEWSMADRRRPVDILLIMCS